MEARPSHRIGAPSHSPSSQSRYQIGAYISSRPRPNRSAEPSQPAPPNRSAKPTSKLLSPSRRPYQVRPDDLVMSEETQLGIETTWESMPPSKSESSTPKTEENPHLKFISLSQKLNFNILPMTWQPALDTVSEEATAKIRQSLINAQTSFAFKRFERHWETRSDADQSNDFQRVYSEISALGQPEIRGHPNIIKLEGLCWDTSPDNKELWPVLVLEKASFGNLTEWSASGEGKTTASDVRLKLCADVANAVRHLHMHRRYLAFPFK